MANAVQCSSYCQGPLVRPSPADTTAPAQPGLSDMHLLKAFPPHSFSHTSPLHWHCWDIRALLPVHCIAGISGHSYQSTHCIVRISVQCTICNALHCYDSNAMLRVLGILIISVQCYLSTALLCYYIVYFYQATILDYTYRIIIQWICKMSW